MKMDVQHPPDTIAAVENLKQSSETCCNCTLSGKAALTETTTDSACVTVTTVLVMRRTDGGTMNKVSPFLIDKVIKGIAGEVRHIKKLRGGSLNIEPACEAQTSALLAMKSLGPYPVTVKVSCQSYRRCIGNHNDKAATSTLVGGQTNNCCLCRKNFTTASDSCPSASEAITSAADISKSSVILQDVSSTAIVHDSSLIVSQDSPVCAVSKESILFDDPISSAAVIDSSSIVISQDALSAAVLRDSSTNAIEKDSFSDAMAQDLSSIVVTQDSRCTVKSEKSPSAAVLQDSPSPAVSQPSLSRPSIPSLLSFHVPCPFLQPSRQPRIQKPWWNAECQSSRQAEQKAWKVFQKYPTHTNFVAHKQAKSKARHVRRQCQKDASETA